MYNTIIVRNNFFKNVSYRKYGLLVAFVGDYINSELFIENNHFENIEHLNSDMPTMFVQGASVVIKNITIANSKISNVLRLSAFYSTTSDFTIINCTGSTSKFKY
jgi:hypothetical protein